jgi:SAM-dependent methyltransferase
MQHLRRLVHATRQSVSRMQRRLARRLGRWEVNRQSALDEELGFWEGALRDKGRHWNAESYRKRTDPGSELQEDLKKLIPAPVGATVRILDVGAGPLTRLGKHWAGRKLQISAIDPLAHEYDAMLARLGITPPLRTVLGHGEKLDDLFPQEHFDLACASNSLDHGCDPLRIIEQMVRVVKREHFVYLWHFANVGDAEAYAGLHQWNFDIKAEDFFISDGRRSSSLAQRFGERIQLQCEEDFAFGSRVVIAKIRKLS